MTAVLRVGRETVRDPMPIQRSDAVSFPSMNDRRSPTFQAASVAGMDWKSLDSRPVDRTSGDQDQGLQRGVESRSEGGPRRKAGSGWTIPAAGCGQLLGEVDRRRVEIEPDSRAPAIEKQQLMNRRRQRSCDPHEFL